MAHALYTNNATATLAGGISSSATTIVLNSGQGSLFPAPTGGDYFYGTLTDAATGTLIEIVKVTSRTADSMVVARGQQGTTAQAYNANDKFELRVTAGGLSELAALDGFTVTGPIVLSGNAVNSLEAVPKQQLDTAIAGVSVPDASTTVKGKVQLATASEAQAFSDTLKAITPSTLASAFGGSNQSLVSNGYQKLPSGLIIQWGTGSAVANNVSQNIVFPTSFPNAVFAVYAQSYRPTDTIDDGFSGVSSITKSQFTVVMNSTGGTFAPMWFAIGF